MRPDRRSTPGAGASSRARRRWRRRLPQAVRAERSNAGGVDALMLEFSLDSREGIALMCLAEALLRIPDAATRDRLIRDKIEPGRLARARRRVAVAVRQRRGVGTARHRQARRHAQRGHARAGAALAAAQGRRAADPQGRRSRDAPARPAVRLGPHDRGSARERARARSARLSFSFDMLGEAAMTAADARTLFRRLRGRDPRDRPRGGRTRRRRGTRHLDQAFGAASALFARAARARDAPSSRRASSTLAQLAKRYDIGFNIDAEEADRLDLSLDLLARARRRPVARGLGRPGLRRAGVPEARAARDRLAGRARAPASPPADAAAGQGRVLGRRDQARAGRRPARTIRCSRARCTPTSPTSPARRRCSPRPTRSTRSSRATTRSRSRRSTRWPATPPTSSSACTAWARASTTRWSGKDKLERACRIYAPVGSHETLLAYLVRRLLENGANTSFVNRIVDPAVSIAELVADPVARRGGTGGSAARRHPVAGRAAAGPAEFARPRPFRRRRARGARGDAGGDRRPARTRRRSSRHGGSRVARSGVAIAQSRRPRRLVGTRGRSDARRCRAAPSRSPSMQGSAWSATPAAERAACLERAADLLEAERATFLALAVREAGKTLGQRRRRSARSGRLPALLRGAGAPS